MGGGRGDRSWAMLGSHNFLTLGDKSQEREVGLWTNDQYVNSDRQLKRGKLNNRN